MIGTTNREQTIRTRQGQVLTVLDELIAMDLPPASWRISDGVSDCLLGHIDTYQREPNQVQADIARWSAFLGVPVTERLVHRKNQVELLVTGKRDEVEIQVFTHADRPAQPQQPAAPEA